MIAIYNCNDYDTYEEPQECLTVTYWTDDPKNDRSLVVKDNVDRFRASVAAITLSAKGKTVRSKCSKLRRKKLTITAKNAYKISGHKGKMIYRLAGVTKTKFRKYYSVNTKTGKITVKKGLAKGTYKEVLV